MQRGEPLIVRQQRVAQSCLGYLARARGGERVAHVRLAVARIEKCARRVHGSLGPPTVVRRLQVNDVPLDADPIKHGHLGKQRGHGARGQPAIVLHDQLQAAAFGACALGQA